LPWHPPLLQQNDFAFVRSSGSIYPCILSPAPPPPAGVLHSNVRPAARPRLSRAVATPSVSPSLAREIFRFRTVIRPARHIIPLAFAAASDDAPAPCPASAPIAASLQQPQLPIEVHVTPPQASGAARHSSNPHEVAHCCRRHRWVDDDDIIGDGMHAAEGYRDDAIGHDAVSQAATPAVLPLSISTGRPPPRPADSTGSCPNSRGIPTATATIASPTTETATDATAASPSPCEASPMRDAVSLAPDRCSDLPVSNPDTLSRAVAPASVLDTHAGFATGQLAQPSVPVPPAHFIQACASAASPPPSPEIVVGSNAGSSSLSAPPPSPLLHCAGPMMPRLHPRSSLRAAASGAALPSPPSPRHPRGGTPVALTHGSSPLPQGPHIGAAAWSPPPLPPPPRCRGDLLSPCMAAGVSTAPCLVPGSPVFAAASTAASRAASHAGSVPANVGQNTCSGDGNDPAHDIPDVAREEVTDVDDVIGTHAAGSLEGRSATENQCAPGQAASPPVMCAVDDSLGDLSGGSVVASGHSTSQPDRSPIQPASLLWPSPMSPERSQIPFPTLPPSPLASLHTPSAQAVEPSELPGSPQCIFLRQADDDVSTSSLCASSVAPPLHIALDSPHPSDNCIAALKLSRPPAQPTALRQHQGDAWNQEGAGTHSTGGDGSAQLASSPLRPEELRLACRADSTSSIDSSGADIVRRATDTEPPIYSLDLSVGDNSAARTPPQRQPRHAVPSMTAPAASSCGAIVVPETPASPRAVSRCAILAAATAATSPPQPPWPQNAPQLANVPAGESGALPLPQEQRPEEEARADGYQAGERPADSVSLPPLPPKPPPLQQQQSQQLFSLCSFPWRFCSLSIGAV